MRRALLLLMLLALTVQTGQAQGASGQAWTCSVDNLADSGVLCIQAAEPGMRRYVTDIVAQSTTGTAGLFNLIATVKTATGGSDCLATGATVFPAGLDANGSRFVAAGNGSRPTWVVLRTPLVIPSDRDLCVIGDPSNPVTVQLFGRVAP